MFRTKKLCPGSKNIFCFRAAKFVLATHVSRVAKLITFASATMFPSLARPLARNSEPFIPCLYRKTIRVKQAKVHFGLYNVANME